MGKIDGQAPPAKRHPTHLQKAREGMPRPRLAGRHAVKSRE
jgi:hypothetical protein